MNEISTEEAPSEREDPALVTPTYEDRLAEVRRQLEGGRSPASVTVRQFIEWFGYARRGRWVVKQIRDALHEFGLHTDPDFEYAWIDMPIVFLTAAGAAAKTPTAHEGPGKQGDGGAAGMKGNEGAPSANGEAAPLPLYADPMYRIGKLSFANRPPLGIHPESELMEALTLMLQHDYSQLPVMTGERDVRGLISWKSIAVRAGVGAPCVRVRDCMGDAPEIVSNDASLFRVINLVVEQECVLVRDRARKIVGIVTASDLSETFHQLGRPFLLLGEIENLIRGLLDGKFSAEELKQIRNPGDSGRPVDDVSDLTFGEYVRLLQEPSRWNRLGLKIDRGTFVKDLLKVNGIRNDVMHFDPEGITPEELDELRKTAKFLQDVRAIQQSIAPPPT